MKLLGMIVDANPNLTKPDVWALVLNNVVVNTIMASTNDIQSIYKTYDYCIDVTIQGQPECGTGSCPTDGNTGSNIVVTVTSL